MAYDQEIPSYGDVMTRVEFIGAVRSHAFIDYDGFAHPVKDGKADNSIDVIPSFVGTGRSVEHTWKPKATIADLPADATHVVWFNK